MDEKVEGCKTGSGVGAGAVAAVGGGALIAWAEPRALGVWAAIHAALATAVLLQGAFGYAARRWEDGSASRWGRPGERSRQAEREDLPRRFRERPGMDRRARAPMGGWASA